LEIFHPVRIKLEIPIRF
jgi:hypothetical protein